MTLLDWREEMEVFVFVATGALPFKRGWVYSASNPHIGSHHEVDSRCGER